MSSQKVEKYLQDMSNKIEDANIAEAFQQLEGFYANKLWNQLSDLTKQLVNNSQFVNSKLVKLDDFYENLIKDFEHRIHSLQLIEIIIPIAENKFKKDKTSAFEFLKKFERTVENDEKALIRLLSGKIKLHLEDKEGPATMQSKEMNLTRKIIEDTEERLDRLVEVGPVHAAFYKVSAEYQRQIGDYAQYYTEALRYLGCENLDKLSIGERNEHALLLCVAALLGKGVYNFGELLAHPILGALEGSPKGWFVGVLNALNSGNWDEFQKYKAKLEVETVDLKNNMAMVEEKLRLLCLMEMAVQLPPKQRNLPFDKIAKDAHLEEDFVELLVMKALANGLIQGQIDQVSQIVNIAWVQPRVLSPDQIRALAERMNEWRKDVNKSGDFVQKHANDVIISYSS